MKIPFSFVASLSLLFTGIAYAAPSTQPTMMILGDATSEHSGHLDAQNSTTGTDANGQSFRRLEKGGTLTFELPCDPQGQNYFSARLNGSETNSGYLYLIQGDGGKDVLNPTEPEAPQGALDFSSGNAPFLGRYYYDTTIIPKALTLGKTSVKLSVLSRGSFNFYGGHIQADQNEPSKAIYLVAVSNQPYFSQPDEEKMGQMPPRSEPIISKNGETAYQQLQGETVKALDTLLSWQLTDDSFQKARASFPTFSRMLEGAVVTGQDLRTATTDGRAGKIGRKSIGSPRFPNPRSTSRTGVRCLALECKADWIISRALRREMCLSTGKSSKN